MSESPECFLGDDVFEATATDTANGPDDFAQIADGDLSVVDILRIVFDMGVGEREVYAALVGQEYSSAGDLADQLDRDRSNINRVLAHLHQHGFVTRRRRILQSGGYLYQYCVRSPEEVRRRLLYGVRQWATAACDEIDQFVDEQRSNSSQNAAAGTTERAYQ
jgi:predicted transcriptional regulator